MNKFIEVCLYALLVLMLVIFFAGLLFLIGEPTEGGIFDSLLGVIIMKVLGLTCMVGAGCVIGKIIW